MLSVTKQTDSKPLLRREHPCRSRGSRRCRRQAPAAQFTSRSIRVRLSHTQGALPPENDNLMSQGDELKFRRSAAVNTEREQGKESPQSRSCTSRLWRRCEKILNHSRRFTVLSRDRSGPDPALVPCGGADSRQLHPPKPPVFCYDAGEAAARSAKKALRESAQWET